MSGDPVPSRKAEAIRRSRDLAGTYLHQALREGDTQPSEHSLCARWARLLAGENELMEEGWYQPPPNGISALIGAPPDFARMSYVSLRHEATWPRPDIGLDDGALLYAYASPVDRETKMIGDLGVTLYNGDEPRIKEHLATCLDITAQIADHAEVGMRLCELYAFASDLIGRASLANETFSTTDQTGGIDIGHTLPWSYDSPTNAQQEALDSGDPVVIAGAISGARVFLNADEQQRILPTMSFTVEPRMAGPGAPLASYHVIVSFADGEKRIRAGFSDLFELFGMTSYLPRRALDVLAPSGDHRL